MAANLTPKDMTLLGAIFQHNTNPVVVDWDIVAEQAGHKNGRVSAEMFRQLKKKLGIETNNSASSGAPKATPTKKRSRAKGTKIEEIDVDAQEPTKSPTKKAKRTTGNTSQKINECVGTCVDIRASDEEEDSYQTWHVKTEPSLFADTHDDDTT